MTGRLICFCGVIVLTIASCQNSGSRYLDLSTNKYFPLKKDTISGYMMNSRTGEPVDFYVDTKTHDTIYGVTGEIVNGKLRKTDEGKWLVKIGGDEYKVRSESENSAKMNMEDDAYKAKNGSRTIKEEDGNTKIENGNTQVKIDGKTGQRKVKKDKNATDRIRKIFH